MAGKGKMVAMSVLGKGLEIIVLLGVGAALGLLFARPQARNGAGQVQSESTGQVQIWTCSMHPQIRLPRPGLCPICNMELIPLETDQADQAQGPWELGVGQVGARLMDVEVAPVQRRPSKVQVRMVGKVQYDQTRLANITAWIPGRLDRLFVDYTGIPVRKGDHLVELYSPRLLTAQEELLQAIRTAQNTAGANLLTVRQAAQATVEAAREKLRLWGLTSEQIAAIETSGRVSDRMTIYSPVGGIVIHKHALEGQYVNEGSPIYTIADLSEVWVKLDAYESDLQWLRYGQQVEFTTVAYPGEVFTGTIAFIDPVLDPGTRTAKVRVNVPNPDGRLKPEMFVKAVVNSHVAAAGRVVDPALAGKWICPMHPQVVKDGPGACDQCGMDLVTTESLGYAAAEPAEPPLVIPASAPLITGTRAVVYIRKGDPNQPTFEGRQIELGPRAGDTYLVRSGLAEGELVVVKGNFKIDSALQILARPSMMNPQTGSAVEPAGQGGPDAGRGTITDALGTQLGDLVRAYLAVHHALANGDPKAAANGARQMQSAAGNVEMALFGPEDHMAWMQARPMIGQALARIAEAGDLQAQREAFAMLSIQVMGLARRFGPLGAHTLFVIHCPMAFDNRGADWIQDSNRIQNPYFGSAMPGCGSVEQVIGR